MNSERTAPYGTWPSPVTGIDVAQGEALLEWVGFCGEEVWWTEARPAENGRNALVRRGPDGAPQDVLPPGWDVRSRVIEYGGRPWSPLSGRAEDGIVFASWQDQRLHRWVPGTDPVPLSPPGPWPGALRYCDFSVRDGEVWCLRETVADAEATDVRRHLVAVPLDGSAAEDEGAVRVLAATHHFMTGPRIEPGGHRVAWLGWDHPAMPWHGTELMLAQVEADGGLTEPTCIAGGPDEAVTQIEWAREPGALYAVTDPDGWWNVHQVLPHDEARNLLPCAEEFGEALWRIGARWCLPLDDGRLAVVHGTSSRRLGILAPDGKLADLESPYGEWQSAATDGRRVAAVVSGPRNRRTVVVADPGTGEITVVREPRRAHDEYATKPYRTTYQTLEGIEVAAHIYPPHHPGYRGPDEELPPYIVFVHGGPTNRSHMVMNQEITFFTSRGFGVADVQYGGSTGLGREYRERLRGQWGVVDVEDCAVVARGLIRDRIADPRRIAIRGGSAGGWTAAASLVAEPDLYLAAGIYFPVLDLVDWREGGTHDFESQYLDSLAGPWPEARGLYHDRSPVNHPEDFRAPFVLFQGLDDNVCPPAQARTLIENIEKTSSVPCGYLTFEGEGHGFRRAETIAACLDAELALYRRTFAPYCGLMIC